MPDLDPFYTVRIQRPLHIVAKKLRAIITSSLHAAGKRWFREFLPKHFTEEGAREYGYEPRSARYIIRKRKAYTMGKTSVAPAPLVYTGRMKAMATSVARIRASSKRVSVRMSMPPYYRMRGKTGTGPEKDKELTATSHREALNQRGFIINDMYNQIQKIRQPETERLAA